MAVVQIGQPNIGVMQVGTKSIYNDSSYSSTGKKGQDKAPATIGATSGGMCRHVGGGRYTLLDAGRIPQIGAVVGSCTQAEACTLKARYCLDQELLLAVGGLRTLAKVKSP